MDWEAPVDAWYVWIGAAIVTVALAGIVLALPQQPPPDATRAANTIDRVAGSSMGAEGTYDHDAEMVQIGVHEISMRNDGGTSHATVTYGPMAPVNGSDDLEAILYGGHPSEEYSDPNWEDELHSDVQAAERDALRPKWRKAHDTLRVVAVDYQYNGTSHTAVLVDA